MFILMPVIFVLGILAIALEDKIKINKAAIALFMAISMWMILMFDAVSKFQSLCATYGIDKAIFDKIQHVLDGLVTDDLDLLQLT